MPDPTPTAIPATGFSPDVPNPRCMMALTEGNWFPVIVPAGQTVQLLPADPSRIGFYVVKETLGFNSVFITPFQHADLFQGDEITPARIHRFLIYDFFQTVSWEWLAFASGATNLKVCPIRRPF